MQVYCCCCCGAAFAEIGPQYVEEVRKASILASSSRLRLGLGPRLSQMRPAATSTNHSTDHNRRSAGHTDLCSLQKARSATIGGRQPA